MQLFYTTDIQGDLAYFNEVEARHIVQVLRHQVGDLLHFVDGHGTLYRGRIVEARKKSCALSILHRESAYKQRSFALHVAIAPPKNTGRFEWFLEKATELGIDRIIPLHCERSERSRLRLERLEKVLLAAMKQSSRLLPSTAYWVSPICRPNASSPIVRKEKSAPWEKIIGRVRTLSY